MKYIIQNDSLTVIIDGDPYVITSSDKNFSIVRDLLISGDYQKIVRYLDKPKFIEDFFCGSIFCENGTITYKNPETDEIIELSGPVTSRILDAAYAGDNYSKWARFLDKLMSNPTYHVIESLYDFIEANGLEVNGKGDIFALKYTTEDCLDCHTETIDNRIGCSPSMPRNQVNDDRDNSCAEGLHLGSYDFVKNRSFVVLALLNPVDVVCVPKGDPHKIRCCGYTVLDFIDNIQDYSSLKDLLTSRKIIE